MTIDVRRTASAAVLLLLATALPRPAAGQGTAMTGEHGLGVWIDGDRLVVGWLTDGAERGLLEAVVDGRVVHRDTTPRGGAHEVSFPRPDAPAVTLRYGALPGDSGGGTGAGELHETTIRPGEEPPDDDVVVRGVDSLYVVGAVHGHHGRRRRLLEHAGLVDADGAWTGGRSHLVLLGDLFDRGPDVTKTLWFVYGLEAEARAAGGRVHLLLGNHEIMVLTDDLRYVSGKERLVAHRHGRSYAEMYHVDRTLLGRWLASKPVALRIDDVLLAHGGIGPAYLEQDVRALDDTLRTYLDEALFRYWSDTTVALPSMDSTTVMRRYRFFFEGASPLWYRGYARGEAPDSTVDRMLEAQDARLHVIGHTTVPSVRSRYGGRVILVDLREPATEMLLRARDGEGWARRVIGLEGEPRPLTEDAGDR